MVRKNIQRKIAIFLTAVMVLGSAPQTAFAQTIPADSAVSIENVEAVDAASVEDVDTENSVKSGTVDAEVSAKAEATDTKADAKAEIVDAEDSSEAEAAGTEATAEADNSKAEKTVNEDSKETVESKKAEIAEKATESEGTKLDAQEKDEKESNAEDENTLEGATDVNMGDEDFSNLIVNFDRESVSVVSGKFKSGEDTKVEFYIYEYNDAKSLLSVERYGGEYFELFPDSDGNYDFDGANQQRAWNNLLIDTKYIKLVALLNKGAGDSSVRPVESDFIKRDSFPSINISRSELMIDSKYFSVKEYWQCENIDVRSDFWNDVTAEVRYGLEDNKSNWNTAIGSFDDGMAIFDYSVISFNPTLGTQFKEEVFVGKNKPTYTFDNKTYTLTEKGDKPVWGVTVSSEYEIPESEATQGEKLSELFEDENIAREVAAFLYPAYEYSTDLTATPSQLKTVTHLLVNGRGIKSLKGIEKLPYLITIYADDNELETFPDLSKNTKLNYASFERNYIPKEEFEDGTIPSRMPSTATFADSYWIKRTKSSQRDKASADELVITTEPVYYATEDDTRYPFFIFIENLNAGTAKIEADFGGGNVYTLSEGNYESINCGDDRFRQSMVDLADAKNINKVKISTYDSSNTLLQEKEVPVKFESDSNAINQIYASENVALSGRDRDFLAEVTVISNETPTIFYLKDKSGRTVGTCSGDKISCYSSYERSAHIYTLTMGIMVREDFKKVSNYHLNFSTNKYYESGVFDIVCHFEDGQELTLKDAVTFTDKMTVDGVDLSPTNDSFAGEYIYFSVAGKNLDPNKIDINVNYLGAPLNLTYDSVSYLSDNTMVLRYRKPDNFNIKAGEILKLKITAKPGYDVIVSKPEYEIHIVNNIFFVDFYEDTQCFEIGYASKHKDGDTVPLVTIKKGSIGGEIFYQEKNVPIQNGYMKIALPKGCKLDSSCFLYIMIDDGESVYSSPFYYNSFSGTGGGIPAGYRTEYFLANPEYIEGETKGEFTFCILKGGSFKDVKVANIYYLDDTETPVKQVKQNIIVKSSKIEETATRIAYKLTADISSLKPGTYTIEVVNSRGLSYVGIFRVFANTEENKRFKVTNYSGNNLFWDDEDTLALNVTAFNVKDADALAVSVKNSDGEPADAFDVKLKYTPTISGDNTYLGNIKISFENIDYKKLEKTYSLDITYNGQKPVDLVSNIVTFPVITGNGMIMNNGYCVEINIPRSITLPATIYISDVKDNTVYRSTTLSTRKGTYAFTAEDILALPYPGMKYNVSVVDANNTIISYNNIKLSTRDIIIEPTAVKLDKADMKMTIGQEADLKATITPDNATVNNIPTFVSDAPEVATVTTRGNIAVVKAISAGKATITVSTGNGKTASCVVNVADVRLFDERTKSEISDLTMKVSDEWEVFVNKMDGAVPTFTVANTKIAKVTVDASDKYKAIISAVGIGETTLKISLNGFVNEIPIKVNTDKTLQGIKVNLDSSVTINVDSDKWYDSMMAVISLDPVDAEASEVYFDCFEYEGEDPKPRDFINFENIYKSIRKRNEDQILVINYDDHTSGQFKIGTIPGGYGKAKLAFVALVKNDQEIYDSYLKLVSVDVIQSLTPDEINYIRDDIGTINVLQIKDDANSVKKLSDYALSGDIQWEKPDTVLTASATKPIQYFNAIFTPEDESINPVTILLPVKVTQITSVVMNKALSVTMPAEEDIVFGTTTFTVGETVKFKPAKVDDKEIVLIDENAGSLEKADVRVCVTTDKGSLSAMTDAKGRSTEEFKIDTAGVTGDINVSVKLKNVKTGYEKATSRTYSISEGINNISIKPLSEDLPDNEYALVYSEDETNEIVYEDGDSEICVDKTKLFGMRNRLYIMLDYNTGERDEEGKPIKATGTERYANLRDKFMITSSNPMVARVESDGDYTYLQLNREGTSTLKVTSKDSGRAVTTIDITVRDYTPTLASNMITLGKYEANTCAQLLLAPMYDDEIINVSFAEGEEDAHDYLSLFESDGKYLVKFKDEASQASYSAGGLKGGFNLKVETDKGGSGIFHIAIKLDTTKPKTTLKMVDAKPNLYYDDIEAVFDLSKTTGVIESVTDVTAAYYSDEDAAGTAYEISKNANGTYSFKKKLSGAAVTELAGIYKTSYSFNNRYIKIKYRGYTDEASEILKVKISPVVKPIAIKADKAILIGDSDKVVVNVYDSKTKEYVDLEGAVISEKVDGDFRVEDGELVLSPAPGKNKSTCKILLKGTTQAIPLSVQVGRSLVPELVSGIKLITLNVREAAGRVPASEVPISVKGCELIPEDIKLTATGSAENLLTTGYLRSEYRDGKLYLNLVGDKPAEIRAGSYSFTVTGKVRYSDSAEPINAKPVKISVKISEKPIDVSLKLSGNIDLLNRAGTSMAYGITVKETIATVKSVEVIGEGASMFEMVNDTPDAFGKVYVKAREGAIFAKASYPIILKVNLSNAISIEKATTVKLIQKLPKLGLSVNSLTLYKRGISEATVYGNLAITAYEGELKLLEDKAGANFTYEDGVLRVKPSCVAKNYTLTFYYDLKDANKSAAMPKTTVKVMVK